MPRATEPPTPAGPVPDTGAETTPQPASGASAGALASLSDLPVAGLTRRRIAILLAALVAAWIIVLFARQVGEASEATTRADAMRVQNEAMAADVAALEAEKELIQRQAYIEQQAREYRLGGPREIPFILADDAPALGADSPGTAANRLGASTDGVTPLDSWLTLLFGAADDPAARMDRPVPSEPPTPEPSY